MMYLFSSFISKCLLASEENCSQDLNSKTMFEHEIEILHRWDINSSPQNLQKHKNTPFSCGVWLTIRLLVYFSCVTSKYSSSLNVSSKNLLFLFPCKEKMITCKVIVTFFFFSKKSTPLHACVIEANTQCLTWRAFVYEMKIKCYDVFNGERNIIHN